MRARALLFYFCLLLSIKSIQNTQCAWSASLAGHCGCCPLIGGSCVHFNSLDNLDMFWHLCVPKHHAKNFSLDECRPGLVMDKNHTRLCRTKNGTFRLFPQCTTKDICLLPLPPRNCMSEPFSLMWISYCELLLLAARQCSAPMSVVGTCEKTLTRYTFDAAHGRCVAFNYTGCGGTANRFLRQDRCKKVCIKPKWTLRRW